MIRSRVGMETNWNSCPRYYKHDLSEDQILEIAKRAVILAREDQEKEIGRLTKKGFLYLIGALCIGVYSWAVAHGFIEIK
jgi:hypothetical protein